MLSLGVGLGLQRKPSPLLGPELLTNGNFESGFTGWSFTGTLITPTVSAGVATLTETGLDGTSARIYQSFTTVIGATYAVSIGLNAASGRGALVINNSNAIGSPIYTSGGQGTGSLRTLTAMFIATATTTFIIIDANGSTATSLTIQACTVRRRT